MKFGRKITNDLYNEWRSYYLDYNLLKRELKARITSHAWSADDERDFIALLEKELDKIHDFQKQKTTELSRRIKDAEKAVKRLVTEEYIENGNGEGQSSQNGHHHTHPTDTEAQQRRHGITQDGGSDDDDTDDESDSEDVHSLDALEDQFLILEEEVATLVADVHDLALYTKLNITGFMKILKKQTGRTLKTSFVQDYLEKRPFYKYNWDSLIVKLSKLYDLVRTRGHPVQGDSSAGGSQSAFVRQTTKYWVHPDNLVHLKLAILKHLPVLVFNAAKEFDAKDAAITSIYFDNEDLELYLGRLEKTEGAEAVRLRWYGDVDQKTIFVERKTHREDWTGEKSVKARFPIKEQLVNAFLRGEYTMDEEFQALVTKGKKTQEEVDSMIQLANEVQYSVLTKRLVPVMRTFYNRTAFQLPGDARVRISLDTELTMVREDNWDGEVRSGDNWRRTDIGINHPFDQLPPSDKELFKYGVLEVKLQTQYGQEPPQWVTDLVSSHLVEAVPKFSKFIHGCATLLPERVDLVPFWLPQMDVDILKPDTGALQIERPLHSTSRTSGSERQGSGSSGILTPEHPSQAYVEPMSEGEEDEELDLTPVRIEDNKSRALSIDPLAPSSAFDETLRDRLKADAERQRAREAAMAEDEEEEEEEEDENQVGPSQRAMRDSERLLERSWRAPPGKKIAVPVRIEPKVYFATERTFLKWLHFAIYIGTIATTLLNFIPPEDTVGLVSAGLFTFVALAAIAYSAIIFVYRAYSIRHRLAEGMYYDKYGPTLLAFFLLAAILVNIGLRLREMVEA
ncbi:hypothetical protein PHLGIDRAFT_31341 [Phlebiopsis gigantea 11061_1 CR5-6]|uniref:Vacuolar transporter chaperone complex subunit 4 n=1 Tax=Phlebiopsis gigantea (strain 11061_1 CR5-6) TaxID=745531 RepID=A0A0C3PFR6_PHLG1|nr:hypothetical protein PHLGIDRAFT_31341 [Phlebiopsis gigantea 11061_1 CR5-6]